jgi:hypothetical protein
MTLDFDATMVVDVHCHPWRNSDLLALDPDGFEDRVTMMGMCQITSGQMNPTLERHLALLSESTPFALVMRARLSAWLGCNATRKDVAAARNARLASDGAQYVSALLRSVQVTALLYDEGYPQPTIPREEFQAQCGVPVHRVFRIEPLIAALRAEASSYSELAEAFDSELDRAAMGGAVAFKSVIAYRTGLDIGTPTRGECEDSFSRWRKDGLEEHSAFAKPVRDGLLHRTVEAARRHDRIVHIHCGGGDPQVVLTRARPQDLFPFLSQHSEQPIVLIHSGWPWAEEAAYIASILPYVYLDVSVLVPWASLAIDQKLEVIVGTAPPRKILYGSDEASEPEVIWLAAQLAREALCRVLTCAVERGWLDESQARSIGEGILAKNALSLHALSA